MHQYPRVNTIHTFRTISFQWPVTVNTYAYVLKFKYYILTNMTASSISEIKVATCERESQLPTQKQCSLSLSLSLSLEHTANQMPAG